MSDVSVSLLQEPSSSVRIITSPSKRSQYGSVHTTKNLLRECLEKRTPSISSSRDDLHNSTPDTDTARSYKNEIICTILCCSGNVAHGFAYGLASPAVPELVTNAVLTEDQGSWFESLLTLGALVGGICVGIMTGLIGRRGTILLSSFPFISGWILIALARGYAIFYVGRILTGFGYGVVQVACPLYIAETVSKEVRGSLSLSVVLAGTSGILGQYCFGMVLTTQWLAVVSMVPVLVMFVGMIIMPESPRWLLSKGRKEKALANLVWLRASTIDAVLQEFNEMVVSIESVTGFQDICSVDTLRYLPGAIKPLAICMMLFIFQQLSGITPVMFNAQSIFQEMQISESAPYFITDGQIPAIVLALFKMMSTVLGLVLIDKIGRRPLFITCGLIMGVCCFVVGMCAYYKLFYMFWIPLLAIVLYVSAYSVAWGGIPWVVISEIIPLRYRGLATALGAIGTWVPAFVVTQEYLDLVHELSLAGVFWMFGGITFVGTAFAFFWMPETKLRSLESIENELSISIYT